MEVGAQLDWMIVEISSNLGDSSSACEVLYHCGEFELLGTTKGVLWNKGVQGTSASSLAGCTRSAQAADLKCLLCFIAVINLSSEIKSEGCC